MQVLRVEKLKARIHQLEQEVAGREQCMAATSAEKQARAVLSAEQAHERAHERAKLHGYLDGSYLASTQSLFVRVFQAGQVERFYPSSLATASERLMTLGAALNYKTLLKYDALAVEVGSGEQAWREFATHANVDQLAQAILQAQHFFDNLQAMHAPTKGCPTAFCEQ
jgi:cell division septum initiation protein DivIVA